MHGPCQWGHAASADLVTWTHYPPALTSPEHGAAADRHLWSGNLIAHEGRVYAFYTIENRDVYLAVSDGEDLQDFSGASRQPRRHPPRPTTKTWASRTTRSAPTNT